MGKYDVLSMIEVGKMRDRYEAEIAELRKAPTDSGVLESDLICKKFNDGEIDLCALVCNLWNTAIGLEKSDD